MSGAKLYPWVSNMLDLTEDERIVIANEVLKKFRQTSPKAKPLADDIAAYKEYEYYSFSSHLHFVPANIKKRHFVAHSAWHEPRLLMKHKKLPLQIIVGSKFKAPFAKLETIDSMLKAFEIPQGLSWVDDATRMNREQKMKLAELCVNAIKHYRRSKAKDRKWLSDYIEIQLAGKGEFQFRGFCVNCCYIRMDGEKESIESYWIHPWGSQPLLFTHRNFPAIMIVDPRMRLHQNLAGERDMIGYTG